MFLNAIVLKLLHNVLPAWRSRGLDNPQTLNLKTNFMINQNTTKSLKPLFCQTAVRRFGFLFRIFALSSNAILFLIFPEKVENWLIRIYGILFLIQIFIIFLDLYNEKLDRDIDRLNNEINNILNK